MRMTAGVTKSNEGIGDITRNIPGQTRVPKQWSENAFSRRATLPAGAFAPPQIHPGQDEFIHVLEGKFDLILDGSDAVATPGGPVRPPRGIPHGVFNRSEETNKRLFRLSPARKLHDPFREAAIRGRPPTRPGFPSCRPDMRWISCRRPGTGDMPGDG